MSRVVMVWCVCVLGACAAEQTAETPQEAICLDCDTGGGGGGPGACSSVCSTSTACNASCTNGTVTTCGSYGVCASCGSFCTTSRTCSQTCKTSTNAIESCGTFGTCHKYDVYCAYPVITSNGITDNHESFADGPEGYLYFLSAGMDTNKSGTFASAIGGYTYDPSSAWASNFRGPVAVYKPARTQWEFAFGVTYDRYTASWGSGGTPYLYGQQCVAVNAGSTVPALTTKSEQVWEDDECWEGICNPDDYVGSFTMDRWRCNTDVFGPGRTTGWSSSYGATVSGDLAYINYKMWCYSCRNAWSPTCSAGVSP